MIEKPSAEYLQAMIDREVGAKDRKQWQADFIKSVAIFLQRNPLRYRGFGPYWWNLKRIMIDRGHSKFGDFIDAEMADLFDYSDDGLNIAAAYAYSEEMLNTGRMFDSKHFIDHEDGEVSEYIIADETMELLGRM